MNFKHTFRIEAYLVEAYAIKFENGLPSKFQVFINGGFEGFIFYGEEKWIMERTPKTPGKLTDELTQKIGDRLIQIYQ